MPGSSGGGAGGGGGGRGGEGSGGSSGGGGSRGWQPGETLSGIGRDAPDCSLSCDKGTRAAIIVVITIAVLVTTIFLCSCCSSSSKQRSAALPTVVQQDTTLPQQSQITPEQHRRDLEAQSSCAPSLELPRKPEKTVITKSRNLAWGVHANRSLRT